MKQIMQLFLKEMRMLLTDKGIMLLMIGGPLFYSFFYPFPYKDDIVRKVPVAVVDLDKTPNSRQLVRMLDSTEELAVLRDYTDMHAAYKAFLNRDIYGIVLIQKDFQKNLLKNKVQNVKFFTDGSYLIYYKQVTSAVQKAVKTMSAGVEIKKLQSKGLGKAAFTVRAPVSLISKNLYNIAGGYTEYVVPAVFVTIIQQILLIGIGMRAGTVRERKKKYAADIKVPHVFIAKLASFCMFGLLYFIYFFVIMYKFWGFTGGINIAGLFIFLIPFVLSSILMGIFISSFFKDRESSMVFIVVTSIPILFMSGAIWPAYLMPKVIHLLRAVFPMTYGVEGVIHLFVMNAPFKSEADSFAYLWLLTFIYGALAYRAVKKRYPNKI